jgi:hypothetical protein
MVKEVNKICLVAAFLSLVSVSNAFQVSAWEVVKGKSLSEELKKETRLEQFDFSKMSVKENLMLKNASGRWDTIGQRTLFASSAALFHRVELYAIERRGVLVENSGVRLISFIKHLAKIKIKDLERKVRQERLEANDWRDTSAANYPLFSNEAQLEKAQQTLRFLNNVSDLTKGPKIMTVPDQNLMIIFPDKKHAFVVKLDDEAAEKFTSLVHRYRELYE